MNTSSKWIPSKKSYKSPYIFFCNKKSQSENLPNLLIYLVGLP